MSKVPTHISHVFLYTCTHVPMNTHTIKHLVIPKSQKGEQGIEAKRRGKDRNWIPMLLITLLYVAAWTSSPKVMVIACGHITAQRAF